MRAGYVLYRALVQYDIIRNIEPHTLHLKMFMVFKPLSSESVHDLGVGGRHLAMSLLQELPKLNYALESGHRMVISHVAEVRAM